MNYIIHTSGGLLFFSALQKSCPKVRLHILLQLPPCYSPSYCMILSVGRTFANCWHSCAWDACCCTADIIDWLVYCHWLHARARVQRREGLDEKSGKDLLRGTICHVKEARGACSPH